MGYYTGSAADIAAVRTALINACTAGGWTWDSGNDVLWKDGMFVRLQAIDGTNTRLELLGRTALTSGDAPQNVSMAKVCNTAIAFPVTYFAFVFDTEVFFIINYSDTYQWCAFGQSQQAGLPGTGNWVAATKGLGSYTTAQLIGMSVAGGPTYVNVVPALFWLTATNPISIQNYWLHNNFETGYPWHLGAGTGYPYLGSANSIMELLKTQPNTFNNESILMPIRMYKCRAESKFSQVLQIENARHIRIDNYEAEDIIQIGTDMWKVFPWYRKNAAARDGGNNIDHTGTFGWAIRYEGA